MSRVLIMSSWTSVGHVGLSAAAPALQALGHHVTQLPTVILSNHRGWRHVAGRPIPAREILEMVDAIDENGWLDGHDAFLAGYMPSVEHVAAACDIADRFRRSFQHIRLPPAGTSATTLNRPDSHRSPSWAGYH